MSAERNYKFVECGRLQSTYSIFCFDQLASFSQRFCQNLATISVSWPYALRDH